MHLLTFRVAGELYAVDVARVSEVVPRIEPRPIPRTPEFLVGLFGYRGRVVPAIDLGLLLGGAPTPSRLSTRVLLVKTRNVGSDGADRPAAKGGSLRIGLIVEQVDDVVQVGDGRPAFPSMRLDGARFLGPMIQIDPRTYTLAQLIDVDWVLPAPLRDALFGGWEKTDEHGEAGEAPALDPGSTSILGSARGEAGRDPDDEAGAASAVNSGAAAR